MAAAVEGTYACLEVVHSTWVGYRFNLEQNTADNASADQAVVGPRLPVTNLMALDAVAVRLARELAAFGQRLEAGDLVITGVLTAACPFKPGSRLTATFSFYEAWLVDVSARLE